MTAVIVQYGTWLLLLLAVAILIDRIWGLHLGPLPPEPKTHLAPDLGEEVTCRCRNHPHGDPICGLKKLLSESHWHINLWLIQISGPYCAYCFRGH